MPSLSPRQVARAIGVSESSIKRWCDKGVIATHLTAGGHRRIHLRDFISFVKSEDQTLIDASAVGLPVLTNPACREIGSAGQEFTAAVLNGSEAACWQIVANLFVAGVSAAEICDEIFTPAMHAVGDAWECGSAEVFQERRACEVCSHVLHRLRDLIPRPKPDAAVAIGGTSSGDPYRLPSQMVELVLWDTAYAATNLGPDLPFETLSAAIIKYRPKLFWLSVSAMADEETFLTGYRELCDRFASEVAIVVGGRALTPSVREQMQFKACCDTLQQLASVAQQLRSADG